MKTIPTMIPDVIILEPTVFDDARGFFYESYNKKIFEETTGVEAEFVQDNHSKSTKGVLRGLHYQINRPQGKLVRVSCGEVLDVVVDLRSSSKTFGQWVSVTLSAENKRQLWVPPGFAHGFLVVSDTAEFLYKTTDYYVSDDERCICWNDPTLSIEWEYGLSKPTVSEKDQKGVLFQVADVYK